MLMQKCLTGPRKKNGICQGLEIAERLFHVLCNLKIIFKNTMRYVTEYKQCTGHSKSGHTPFFEYGIRFIVLTSLIEYRRKQVIIFKNMVNDMNFHVIFR